MTKVTVFMKNVINEYRSKFESELTNLQTELQNQISEHETTNIQAPETSPEKTENKKPIYDISGKMLNIPKAQLKPGVYVQDGKKFIVK